MIQQGEQAISRRSCHIPVVISTCGCFSAKSHTARSARVFSAPYTRKASASDKHTVMPSIPRKPQTEDSKTFDPDKYFEAWSREEFHPPYDNDFRKFIIRTFGLPMRDDYGYMAQHAEVTLLKCQTHIECGRQNGMHAWYRDAEGNVVGHPPSTAH